MFMWSAMIRGLKDTIWEGNSVVAVIQFDISNFAITDLNNYGSNAMFNYGMNLMLQ